MPLTDARAGIALHLTPQDLASMRRDDAARGLTSRPKLLSPIWLYDDLGCALFDEITRLPEYYPTRTERKILQACAGEVATTVEPVTLVELGAGTADKTRHLLDALVEHGTLQRYTPFDVAEATTRSTVASITAAYPTLEVHGVVGDFRRHLHPTPARGRQLIALLGSTIGNLEPSDRAAFLAGIVATMRPGDALLLGTDLLKDRDRLIAAYDDTAGVTAAFNKNVLRALNRELDADFDLDAFDHRAVFNEHHQRIEMHLQARRLQDVRIAAIGLHVRFTPGETLRTEISTKFEPTRLDEELLAAGLRPRKRWTDPAEDYAVSLAVR